MSATFTFTGTSSVLTSNFYPELELDPSYSYSCGLLEFTTYNSIPNVTQFNNKVYWSRKSITRRSFMPLDQPSKPKTKATKPIVQQPETIVQQPETIVQQPATIVDKEQDGYIAIPTGTYEFKDITTYLINAFKEKDISFEIEVNSKTLKTTVKSSVRLHFDRKDSIHRNFGFNDCVVQADSPKTSEKTVSITSLNTIVVECDIVNGSFTNGKPGHSIHEFSPNSDPGFKIVEIPKHIVYLPINRHKIQSIQVRVVDQDRNLVDFRGEKLTCRIHIRKD